MALEDEVGPIAVRRRLREKVAARGMRKSEEEEEVEEIREDEEDQEQGMDPRSLAQAVTRVLEEEMTLAVTEDQEALDIVLGSLVQLRQMMNAGSEEDEVLQTKIVSPKEVLRKIQEWTPAIQAELKAMFQTKGALREVPEEDGVKLVQDRLADVVPAKMVYTIKPDPGCKRGKLKARIVSCGNYLEEDPDLEVFASGTNAVSARIALAVASMMMWIGIVVDVKAAFLNAPMGYRREGAEDAGGRTQRRSLMKPPHILVQCGLVPRNIWWEAISAVYGYRQSPRLWSDWRDDTLTHLRIPHGEKILRLRQLITEPNLWRIVEEKIEKEDEEEKLSTEEEEMKGLMLVYVDDILIMGEPLIAEEVVAGIQRTWETSNPEKIGSDEGTRLLGMELWRFPDGSWKTTQINYVVDLLKRNLGEDPAKWPLKKTPISKDIVMRRWKKRGIQRRSKPLNVLLESWCG